MNQVTDSEIVLAFFHCSHDETWQLLVENEDILDELVPSFCPVAIAKTRAVLVKDKLPLKKAVTRLMSIDSSIHSYDLCTEALNKFGTDVHELADRRWREKKALGTVHPQVRVYDDLPF